MVSEEKINICAERCRKNYARGDRAQDSREYYTLQELLKDLKVMFPNIRVSEIRRFVRAIFWIFTECFAQGLSVRIHNFGRFTVKDLPAPNRVFDFWNGGDLQDPPTKRRAVLFEPGYRLRHVINPTTSEYVSDKGRYNHEWNRKVKAIHERIGNALYQNPYDKYGNYLGYTDEFAELLTKDFI